jgi:hypothetical protein
LQDIEIIVVDAGSTDGTLEILNEYAQADPRVRLLHSDKKSHGYQCNAGMDAASGEYIGFVETDDYIKEGMYRTLYDAIRRYDLDYVKARYDMFVDLPGERLSIPYSPIPRNKADMYDRVVYGRELEILSATDVNMWNGLYRREFIQKNNIRLNETPGAAFQDTGFVVQTMMLAEKALYIDRPSYCYRRDNPDSSVHGNAPKFMMDEFMYIYPILRAKRRDGSLLLQRTFDRHFGAFGAFLGGSLLRGKSGKGLFEEVKVFREFILDAYHAFNDAERTWTVSCDSFLWSLFVDDFDLYCAFMKESAAKRLETCSEFARLCERQMKLMIFGCGNVGGGVYCYLKRNGLKNTMGFCDNDSRQWGGTYVGQTVFSPAEAMEKHKDAMYVLAVANPYHTESLRRQLIDGGIRVEKICHSPLIYPPESFEISITTKKELS